MTVLVDRVLRGSPTSAAITFSSTPFGDRCPPLDFGRWVVAIDAPDVAPDAAAKATATWPGHPEAVDRWPPGLSWRLPLDDKGYVKGEILRCHGVTVEEGGSLATNEPERMALLHLEGYLRMSPCPLCEIPRSSPSRPRRTIEGQVVYASGEPRRAELEVVPVGGGKRITRFSTDDLGRFRITGLPGGPVWLRSPENNFDPFLLPAGVRRVHAVSRAERPSTPRAGR